MTPRHTTGRRSAARALTTAVAALAIAVFSAMPSLGAMPAGGTSRPQLSVTESAHALLTASKMRPGTVAQRQVSVVNRGTGAGTLWLDVTAGRQDRRGAHFEDVLVATVTDESGTVLAAGTLARFGTRELGRLPAGASRELTVTVSFPADAGAEHMGSRATFDLAWTLDG